ncbi:MAG: hypothetical protein AMXMBFR78_14650 [Rubrivivax sp.]|jgi:uncharacterized membrane protein YqjE
MADPAAGGGLLRSLRRLSDTALEIVQVRLALLGTELEQEKQRLFDALLRAVLGLLLLALALVLAVAFVLLLLQEAYRLPALGVLVLAFAAGAAWFLHGARAALQSGPGGPFALSLAELRTDRAAAGGSAPPEPAARADGGPGKA